ncbi:GDSL-type esterase/lipase family protein [Saccharibacillus alkalitolerans]|uniref:Lysophospholipase n=1 Tax=Saccharibacillus alkalitolerans TaxID=2705290 RepID=A0ABX0F8I1_9BACL|nr:GDSL-type esterase/lipase family protein [Saccharibacillus alkalitolerans]NGZ74322.1 lysophospholipase [Saccharibacillus alkalitolerans]
MNSWKWIWRTTAALSAAATLLLAVGFGYGAKELMFPQPNGVNTDASADAPLTRRSPSVEEDGYRIVAIGDSLAKGTGDTTGQGFARRTAALLDNGTEREVRFLNNLGINGMTTRQLLGELDEPGLRYVLKEANLILLSIGANDLFQGGAALQIGAAAPDTAALDRVLPEAAKRLGEVLDELRSINPSARIVYVGLYNPFGDIDTLREQGDRGITEWNAQASARISEGDNMTLVPTFDLFQRNPAAYLSFDHFHPNSAGYERIAERIVQGLE